MFTRLIRVNSARISISSSLHAFMIRFLRGKNRVPVEFYDVSDSLYVRNGRKSRLVINFKRLTLLDEIVIEMDRGWDNVDNGAMNAYGTEYSVGWFCSSKARFSFRYLLRLFIWHFHARVFLLRAYVHHAFVSFRFAPSTFSLAFRTFWRARIFRLLQRGRVKTMPVGFHTGPTVSQHENNGPAGWGRVGGGLAAFRVVFVYIKK